MLRIALPHIAHGPSSPSFARWREALEVWRRRDRERAELAYVGGGAPRHRRNVGRALGGNQQTLLARMMRVGKFRPAISP
jgi:hypothetical protein